MSEEGWILKDLDGYPLETPNDLYVTQFYFLTSTMTTVGYGDVRAKQIGDGSNQRDGGNMVFIMLVQFMAMAVFAITIKTLLTLKFMKSVN